MRQRLVSIGLALIAMALTAPVRPPSTQELPCRTSFQPPAPNSGAMTQHYTNYDTLDVSTERGVNYATFVCH